MYKDEAILAVIAEHKLTHRYFSYNEYIFMIDGEIISEDGVNHGSVDDFFALRQGKSWDTDWEIYKK